MLNKYKNRANLVDIKNVPLLRYIAIIPARMHLIFGIEHSILSNDVPEVLNAPIPG